MGNHGDVLVDDSVDESRILDKSRTMVEFVDKSRLDKSRTMVEFVDESRDVGKLVEQALVELRT